MAKNRVLNILQWRATFKDALRQQTKGHRLHKWLTESGNYWHTAGGLGKSFDRLGSALKIDSVAQTLTASQDIVSNINELKKLAKILLAGTEPPPNQNTYKCALCYALIVEKLTEFLNQVQTEPTSQTTISTLLDELSIALDTLFVLYNGQKKSPGGVTPTLRQEALTFKSTIPEEKILDEEETLTRIIELRQQLHIAKSQYTKNVTYTNFDSITTKFRELFEAQQATLRTNVDSLSETDKQKIIDSLGVKILFVSKEQAIQIIHSALQAISDTRLNLFSKRLTLQNLLSICGMEELKNSFSDSAIANNGHSVAPPIPTAKLTAKISSFDAGTDAVPLVHIYDSVQCIGFHVHNVFPKSSAGNDMQWLKKLGLTETDDYSLRCSLLLEAIRDAAASRSHDKSPKVLKIFMAPEFFFRDYRGAYSSGTIGGVVQMLIERLNAHKNEWNLKNWVIVAGGGNEFEESAGQTTPYNSTPVVIIDEKGESRLQMVLKQWTSVIDYGPRGDPTLLGGEHRRVRTNHHQHRIADPETSGGGILKVNNLTLGLEICLDHAQGILANTRHVDARLISSGGMTPDFDLLGDSKLVFNVDSLRPYNQPGRPGVWLQKRGQSARETSKEVLKIDDRHTHLYGKSGDTARPMILIYNPIALSSIPDNSRWPR